MAEVAAAAAVYGLITGSIALIRTAIDIYGAVQNEAGIPAKLKKVSDNLPPLQTLLEGAKAQHECGNLDIQVWTNVKEDFEHCEELCKELHDLLAKAYLAEDASKRSRFWTHTKTVLSGKGNTAEQLLKDIWVYLDVFAKKGIVTNTALLREIKDVVDELSLVSGSGSTFNHSGIGDQVAGDQFTGNKYQQGDSGRMFNAPINTINEGTKGGKDP